LRLRLRENFDRFNFALHKEKQMVGFRRCITALAVLALFAGLASAQLINQGQMVCDTNVSVAPLLRAEGFTEQTGDITLTCTGGTAAAVGSQIPQVNITVFLNTAVTSRLLPISGGASNASEALLLIDEPGSGIPGARADQKVCGLDATRGGPATGCTQFVGPTGLPVTAAVAGAPAENVFQGIVSGNSVTWFGIPVLPPVTSTFSRVYRITNVRANATALQGGSAAGSTPVIASISISPAISLSIRNTTPTVGFVLPGLTATATGATSLNQCTNATRAATNTLSFAEGFGTAFKTRTAAQTNTQFAGQSPPVSPVLQNVPGQIYNSESNFILGGISGNSGTAGLADFGTRLKATFNNVPAGVRLFVSLSNVSNVGLPLAPPAIPGGSAANTGTTGYAVLVNGETTSDGNASSGFFPGVVSDGTLAGSNSSGNVPVAEIPVVNGSAVAVWEVINTNPNAQETLRFGVYSTFTANVAQNSPPPGTGSVNLSFLRRPVLGLPSRPSRRLPAACQFHASLQIPAQRGISCKSAYVVRYFCIRTWSTSRASILGWPSQILPPIRSVRVPNPVRVI